MPTAAIQQRQRAAVMSATSPPTPLSLALVLASVVVAHVALHTTQSALS
jgi:hypothetical protein